MRSNGVIGLVCICLLLGACSRQALPNYGIDRYTMDQMATVARLCTKFYPDKSRMRDCGMSSHVGFGFRIYEKGYLQELD